jgi:hypothetical protein
MQLLWFVGMYTEPSGRTKGLLSILETIRSSGGGSLDPETERKFFLHPWHFIILSVINFALKGLMDIM